MAVKKIEELNIHRDVNSTEQFDVQGYLNENWDKMQDVVDNNAEELMQVQKDISTLKEDNKTNKSSIDVLEKSNETRDEKISKNVEDIGIIQKTIKSEKESIDKSLENINTKDEKQDEDIKANKESIEELHAENLEIKAENERLRNDIKSIAVVNEVSGENIHIEDSSDARCELEICGNQQQETRSGKNRIDLGLLGSGTLNGVTYTYNESNQSITFDGTCTKDNTRFIINDDANIQTTAKKTTLTAQYLAGSVSNYFTARIADNEWKHNLLLSLLTLNSSNKKVSLTETEDMVGVHIDIKANSGTIFNNFTIQLMLTDEVDTEYEMYGASPSIPYPSPVKNVGNIKNILDMSNAKNGSSAGIACTMNADGSYKYKGTATSQYINVWFMGGYATDLPTLFTLEPGTYYINDVSLFEGTTGFVNDSSKKIWTFIRAYNVTGVRAPNAISGNTYDETKYPIIAKIDHEIPWVPYNYGYAKIDIFNKNYLSKIPKKSITTQGITSTFDGEKFICKGTAQANYFNLLTENVYKKIGKGIKTFSTNKLKKGRAFIHFDYVDGTSQNYYTSINTNQVRFTLNKDVESYRLNVDSITAGDTIDDNIYVQLEDGNIATEIEKAENQEYLVDVQQPMFEGDTFVKQDAKWCEKHNWKTMSFDGQNVDSQAGGTFADFKENGNIVRTFEIKDLLISSVRNDIFCDKLPRQADSMWNGRSTGIQSWQGQNKILISLPFDDVEKKYGQKLTVDNYVTAFYMYLQNEVLIISYPLAEPILLECTEAQSKVLDEIYNKAHTYKNITNISAESSEVNPIICLKYLKDPETEHNKLQAQIDEIKQLLSTTQTSSLLLDNMQKDLESEV